MSSLLCIPLGFTESILFQCLMIFSWKKCAMINDDFFAMFFNVTNLVVAQMITAIRLVAGQLYRKEQFEIRRESLPVQKINQCAIFSLFG